MRAMGGMRESLRASAASPHPSVWNCMYLNNSDSQGNATWMHICTQSLRLPTAQRRRLLPPCRPAALA